MQLTETQVRDTYEMLMDYRFLEMAKRDDAKRMKLPDIVSFYQARVTKADKMMEVLAAHLYEQAAR